MPSAYSYDLRIRVIKTIETGTKASIVANMFKINKDTVYEWIKLKKSTGDVKSKPKVLERSTRKIGDIDKLKVFIENNKDKTLCQLVILFGSIISKTTMFRYLKRLGYTYKKNSKPSQKGQWIER